MGMRVLVVGGGIGGLATAIALEKVGLDPLVLERAPELTEIGSGLGMTPNAMRVLEWLHAADYVRARGMQADASEWREMDTGERIYERPFAGMEEIYGDVYMCLHRGDLLSALAEQVPSERIRLNAKLTGLEERSDGVVARLASGEEVHGAVLVGADGLRSTVRTLLFGEQEARFTGIASWRGMIALEDMPPGFEHRVVVWPGAGRHGQTYPIRRDLQAFNGFVPSAEIHREEWGPSGDTADLLSSLAGASEEVLHLVRLIRTALITPIYFRDPLPVWGTDRVTLLGDAAHPTPPNVGQGAAMAVEDAVTLAICLRRAVDGLAGGRSGASAAISAALAEFAARRRDRTTGMLIASRGDLAMEETPDPVQQRARNGRLQGMRRLDPSSQIAYGWLYGHDAVAEAERPLASHEGQDRRNGNSREEAGHRMRAEAGRAYELWRGALTQDDHSRLWTGEREGYARFTAQTFIPPAGAVIEPVDCDGLAAVRVTPPADWARASAPTGARQAGTAVLHLHGGGYTMGSARGAAELASRLADAAGGWALVPDYRLAPEHPFPAALDDVVAAYRWLRRQAGVSRIVVSGECAGGGLAVSLALVLRDAGEQLPDLLHVVSPFADLTVTSRSANVWPSPDPWFDRRSLRLCAASYIHTTDPAEPLVSPTRADLRGLPPMLIAAAADEALADDAMMLADRAGSAGVDVSLDLVEDSVHSFVLFEFLPETAAEMGRLTAAIAARELGSDGSKNGAAAPAHADGSGRAKGHGRAETLGR